MTPLCYKPAISRPLSPPGRRSSRVARQARWKPQPGGATSPRSGTLERAHANFARSSIGVDSTSKIASPSAVPTETYATFDDFLSAKAKMPVVSKRVTVTRFSTCSGPSTVKSVTSDHGTSKNAFSTLARTPSSSTTNVAAVPFFRHG